MPIVDPQIDFVESNLLLGSLSFSLESPLKIWGSVMKIWGPKRKVWGSNENLRVSKGNLGVSDENKLSPIKSWGLQ